MFFFTTLSPPCHNRILKLWQGYKVVTRLSQGCMNIVTSCMDIVTKLPQCALSQPCILKLCQGCYKVVARLSQGFITILLQHCTCIMKL